MSTELTAETLIPLSVQERKALILEQASLIDVSQIVDEDLYVAYRRGQVISSIAPAYLQYQIEQDNQNGSVLESAQQSELICSQTNKFAENFIEWLKRDFEKKKLILENHPNPSNIFELCGVKYFDTSNVTRNLSTKIGRLWEEIADISPYVIVPDFEFGIKITGVDIILFLDETVNFAQLKTQKGTLTGSQTIRAIKELGIHDNPLFIAAFNIGESTFMKNSKIPYICGKEFWDVIQIDYDLVENHVRDMLQRIDKYFTELITSSNKITTDLSKM